MEDYQEFLNRLQKRGSKPHRISHCLGARDAFHWVRKNKWKALDGSTCSKLLYGKIIHEVHRELVDMLLEGHEIEFPYQMGSLVLNCIPAKVYDIDGQIFTNYKRDWKKTLEYLYTDKEALEGHKRIRRIAPYVYNVRYYKRKAKFRNRRLYSFRVNRSLVRLVGKAVEKGKVIAEHTEY
jgi:hypothetical protein